VERVQSEFTHWGIQPMPIGPHTKKEDTPNKTRQKAIDGKWGCFQTHWGNPRSLRLLIKDIFEDNDPKPDDPLWVFHAAYVANMTPKPALGTPNTDYLFRMAKQAAIVGASFVVVHVGGTANKPVEIVESQIRTYLTQYKISEGLEEIAQEQGREVKLLIENVAAFYPFNQSLKPLIGIVKDYDHVGWCLDLHHSWAAGIPYSEVQSLAVEDLPNVVHVNYPGSPFGSGRDQHGWRNKWEHQDFTTAEQTIEWDDTLKFLNDKEIPLILEGSKYPESNTCEELEYIQNHILIPCRPDGGRDGSGMLM